MKNVQEFANVFLFFFTAWHFAMTLGSIARGDGLPDSWSYFISPIVIGGALLISTILGLILDKITNNKP